MVDVPSSPRPTMSLANLSFGYRIARLRKALTHPLLWLVGPAVLIMLLLLVYPLLYTLWLSLHKWYGSHATPWEWVGLDNYIRTIGRNSAFQRALVRTTLFTIATVAGSVVLGLGIALLIDRPFPGRSVVIALLLVPIVSTPVAVSMTWKYLLQFEGPLNALMAALGLGHQNWLGEALVVPTLVGVDISRWTALVALVLTAGLASLPTEPLEAAKIDGASNRQLIRYITLPLLQPFIGAAVMLRVIDALKTFDEIQVISGGGPAGASETLYMLGYKLSFTFLNFGAAAAVITFMFLYIMVTSIGLARWRRGH